MRLSSPKRARARLSPALQITSMVDVIFLLLIYFLLSSSYAPPESLLTPALTAQQAGGGRAADLQPQVVEVSVIGGAPGYRIGERTVRDPAELVAILQRLPKDGGVFVKGSDRVATEWAVRAIQAGRDAGFVKVTYVPAE
jgi:biopolymer transport protein ExbD